jgi:hypothetical protein
MCPNFHIICLKCWKARKDKLSGCTISDCGFPFDDDTHPFASKSVIEALNEAFIIDWKGRAEGLNIALGDIKEDR